LTFPFAVAAAANFFHGLALMLYLHLPGLLARWAEDEVTIGLVAAAMAIGAVVVRPFAGRAMDGAGGRRAVMIAAGFGHVIAAAGYLFVERVGPLLWVVRVVHGLSEGALFSALFTAAADIVPVARRTEGLALFGVSGMLPVALGGLLGDFVLAHGDYRDLFGIGLVFATLAFLVSLALPETGTRRVPHASPGPPRRGFVAVAFQRDLRPIWMVGISMGVALGAAYAFLKTFVLHEHVGSVGVFYGWYSAAAIVLRLTLGWVPDRVGPKRVLGPSLVALGFALVALSLGNSDLHVGLAGALAGLGHGYVFPILSGLTAARSRDEERGSAMSLFTAIFDVGILLAGPIFGWIAAGSSLRTMFLVAGAVPIAGAIAFYAWDGVGERAGGAPGGPDVAGGCGRRSRTAGGALDHPAVDHATLGDPGRALAAQRARATLASRSDAAATACEGDARRD
jgi:MFS family permease